MEDLKIQTDEKPEMIDLLSSVMLLLYFQQQKLSGPKYCPEVIGDIPKILKLWTVFVSD
jgi:hypothetical protein